MIQMLLLAAAYQSTDPAPIEGRWTNPAQSVVMLIHPCGEELCGTVDWASEEAKADARKGVDELVGAQLLWNVRQRSEGRWRGRMFIPDQNKIVHGKLELLDGYRLKVSGCALGRSLCKSQVWTRAE